MALAPRLAEGRPAWRDLVGVVAAAERTHFTGQVDA
jgi:hypothetical protein